MYIPIVPSPFQTFTIKLSNTNKLLNYRIYTEKTLILHNMTLKKQKKSFIIVLYELYKRHDK